MTNKIERTLKILAILIAIVLLLIFKFIPEYRNSLGSSDGYIATDKYVDLVGIKINNKIDFILVTTTSKITNILFLDNDSLVLYNQNIENKTFKEGTKAIIELLTEHKYLVAGDTIELTNYNNKTYEQVKKNVLYEIENHNIKIELIEKKISLKEKAQSLNITTNSEDKKILKNLELYSKDLVRHYKNDVSSSLTQQQDQSEINFDETRAHECIDNVYKKIEVYARKNNIINQDISTPSVDITLIPANSSGTIFPDNTSWYYIKDSKVYAYISITYENQNYSYCYQSSIDEYKKGQC